MEQLYELIGTIIIWTIISFGLVAILYLAVVVVCWLWDKARCPAIDMHLACARQDAVNEKFPDDTKHYHMGGFHIGKHFILGFAFFRRVKFNSREGWIKNKSKPKKKLKKKAKKVVVHGLSRRDLLLCIFPPILFGVGMAYVAVSFTKILSELTSPYCLQIGLSLLTLALFSYIMILLTTRKESQ